MKKPHGKYPRTNLDPIDPFSASMTLTISDESGDFTPDLENATSTEFDTQAEKYTNAVPMEMPSQFFLQILLHDLLFGCFLQVQGALRAQGLGDATGLKVWVMLQGASVSSLSKRAQSLLT